MFSKTMFVLLAVIAGALAGPMAYQMRDDKSCARRCTESSKFMYQPGTTYVFDYDIQTHTAMEGASGERSALFIWATADIEVLSKCDMALRLRDVRVNRSVPTSTSVKYVDESGEFRRQLERYPLRFSFQDGIIEELCPQEEESTWALNIKRGLLTAVQNSMDSLDKDQKIKESDVTGECTTNYTVRSSFWFTWVKKTKDLLGCTNRDGYRSHVHAMPYRVTSEIQSLPLMKSTHECEQEIFILGLLSSALIRETHTFRPFSQGTSGATTKIVQKLDYKSQRSGVATRPEYIQRRAGVAFEHAYGPGNEDQPRRDAENKLREICSGIRDDIRPETPRHFSELVYIVKNMDIEGLRRVYQQVKQGKFCGDRRIKKFFLDSLPMASTGASIELMKQVLLSGEVTGAQATMCISSLSFIHYPTEEMLQQVQALLENSQYSQASMLPISTMLNNYCSHQQSCSEEYVIEKIISAIKRVIGRGCYVRDSNLDATMVALRALGNAGHLDRISQILSTCVHRESNPTEVRVTAIQAYRRIPCTSDRSSLMSVYQDSDEDSEVRITAYLAVMQCPDEDILNRVQQTLENERANQVGSFVWSHLTNLIESSSPHKQSIRRILEDQTLKKEFDLETLKYSRNYEGSIFLEKFNTGAMAESNVIFSDKSFLPRSAMLNMTVDLFGNSVNLFEMGGRIEGLEYLIENYLGPYSYFGPAKKPEGTAKLDHLRGDIYMRMFGNELYYNHFMGTDPLASAKKFNLLDMLIKMSDNKDYSFTQSVMFIDSSMIVPTSCGLPLNLTVNGIATIDLQATGVVDLRKLTTSPKSLLIDGILKPSGAIQITGTMSMDAFVTKTGLRVVNTWHSSSALKGRVELQRAKVISADWEFPQNKMEILDVSTAFFSIHGDLEREQDLLADSAKSLELCTGSRLATVTGLEICNAFKWTNASMKEDAPYFPFTGPLSQTLTLYKRDTHTAYKFRAAVSATPYSTGARLEFNTPGSKVDREMAINVDLSSKQKQLEINLVSPWKKAEVKGSLDYKKDNIGMKGKVIVDGRSEYSVISGVAIKKVKTMVTYIPRIVVRRPGVKVIKLVGQISHDGLKKAKVDLQLDGIRRDPITLTGALLNTRVERNAKAVLTIEPKQNYTTEIGLVYQNFGKSKATIKIVPTLVVKTPSVELVTVSGSGDYREGKSLKAAFTMDAYKLLSKPIIVKCDLKRTSGNREKYSGFVMVNSKLVVAKMSGNMQRKKSILSTTITLDYNFPKIRSIKKDRISFSSKFTDRSTKSLWNYQLNTNFEDKRYPLVNFVTNNEFSHNRKLTKVSTSVRYGPKEKTSNRHLTVYAMVNHILDPKTSKVDINLKTEIGPFDTKLNLEGKHINDGRSLDSSMAFGYGPGKTIQTSLSLKNKGRKSVNLYGEASLVYPGKQLNVQTDLVQVKKNYTHTVTLQLDKATSSIVTTYTQPKESIHRITTSIEPHFMKPIQLQAETDLDLKDFKASAQANYDEAAYVASTTFKYTANTNGKWALDVSYPARHVIVEVEGRRKGNNLQGIADAKWDADKDISRRFLLKGKVNQKPGGSFSSAVSIKYQSRDIDFNIKHAAGRQYSTRADLSWEPRKKIQVDTSFLNVESKKGRSVDISLRVRSPFEGYEDIFANATSDNGAKRYATTTQMYWSDRKNQLSSTISIKKPYSLRNLDLSVTATSPFKGYKKMNVEVSYSLESALKTIIKGNIEGKSAKFTLNGENRSNGQKRDIEGSLTVKSTIMGMKGLTVQVSHKDDLKKFSTDALLNIGGDKYSYGFEMNHGISGWQMQNTGKLVLSSPRHGLVNNWQHRNSEKEVSSTLASEWGQGRRIFINVFGNHDAALRTKTLGEINIETPWEPIRKMDFNIDNELGTGLIKHSSSIKQSNDITGSVGINYIRTNGQTTADFKVVSPFTNLNGKTEARYSEHSGNLQAFSTEGILRYMNDKALEGKLTMMLPMLTAITATAELRTPFQGFEDTNLNYQHSMGYPRTTSSGTVTYGYNNKLTSELDLQMSPKLKLNFEIKTPFNDLETNRIVATHDGPIENCQSHLELDVLGTTMSWDSSFEHGIDTRGSISFISNIEGIESFRASLNKEGSLENFRGAASATLKDSTTEAGINGRIAGGVVQGSATIKTPFRNFRDIAISVDHTGNWNDFSSEGLIRYMDGQTLEGKIKLNHNGFEGVQGNVQIKTPFRQYESMSVEHSHRFRPSSVKSNSVISYGYGKEITSDISLETERDITLNAVLKTPFQGYEQSKAIFSLTGSVANFNSHAEVEFHSTEATMDASFAKQRSTQGNIVITTNIPGYENIKGTFSIEGDRTNLKSTALIKLKESTVEADISFDLRRKIEGYVTIRTPFNNFKNIGASILHTGNLRQFTTEGSIRYMDGRVISGRVSANANGNSPYNGQKSRAVIEFRAVDGVHGEVMLSTPFKGYRNLGMSVDHSGEWNQFDTRAKIEYMDRKEITAKISHMNQGLQRIESSIELSTPFIGYELTKAQLQHSAITNEINSNVAVQYGRGEKLTSEIHASSSPKYNFDVKVTTPFSQYEELSASSSFEHGIDRYAFEGKLNAGDGKQFAVDSTVDLSSKPLTAVAHLSTPFEEFDSAEISLSHDGQLNDFHSTGRLRTPLTGPVSGEATLNYQSPFEMNGMVALSNDKKVSIQNTQHNGKYISNILLAWSPREEITFDGSYMLQDAWTSKQLQTEMSVKTPFTIIRQASVRFNHQDSADKYNENIEADYNGNTVLDMDVELLRGSRDQGSITMRQPRPMVITMAGGIINKNLDGEMFVNWDRDEPHSNIRVQTSVTDRSGSTSLDKDLTVKLIHPSRTVGISGNIMHSGQQTKSHGELFWNEDAGENIFYDVAMTDGSRRYNTKYDTTVKIGSPLRSIQMEGSYSNTGVSRSVDGTFYWDADWDNYKQVGMKATLTPGDSNKADISLRLPSISKDIKLDTEMVINDGKTLFNWQTKLSYSTDSRKTLTMTSRLEDISYGYGISKYNFVVGVSHPYTDVDVQMTSHIGSSNRKFSTGINLIYLTARREWKNIVLRGEINNQIELQMMTPVKNIQFSAEVEENPYKLKIRNTYDGKVVRSDLTVDSRRKVIDFQTNYDIDDLSKMIHMKIGYVNSRTVQAVLFHEINSRHIFDSFLAVRLNTSRLLHSRISWRPQMISDIQNFLAPEVKQYGDEVKNAFHSTYEAVRKELSGKYYTVAQAVTEEVTPFVKLLETEMAAFERNLDSIRRDVNVLLGGRFDFFSVVYFKVAFEVYELVYSTKKTFANLKQKIAKLLVYIKRYPVGQKYRIAVAGALGSIKRAVANVVAETVEFIASMDEELQGIRDSYNHHYNRIQKTVSDSVNNIRNHPKLTELRLRFSNTYQDYLDTMSDSLQQLDLNSVMDSARNTLTSQLSRVMHPDDFEQAISLSNNVYQEAVWAYNYWQVEEILKDLVVDELKQYRDELVFLQKSRITVWDPEQGEIQIELYLPIQL